MNNLSMIACVSKDLGLGFQGGLLWNLKPDIQFFRETTMGHPVIMGSRTFESIGKPLPGRENIILSSRPLDIPGVKVFNNLDDLKSYVRPIQDEVFVIGGASLYSTFLPDAHKLYLTEVDGTKPADVFFPEFDQSSYTRTVLKSLELDGTRFQIVEYQKKT